MVINWAEKLIYIYWNIRIFQKLKISFIIKKLIKNDMNFNDLDKESDEK